MLHPSPHFETAFNNCIIGGVFPQSKKIAELIPIFRAGVTSLASYYRPNFTPVNFSKTVQASNAQKIGELSWKSCNPSGKLIWVQKKFQSKLQYSFSRKKKQIGGPKLKRTVFVDFDWGFSCS